MIRLFIAFPIEPAVRERLAGLIGELRSTGRNVKWVDPTNLHLTARFLGDTDPGLVKRLTESIQAACRSFQPVKTTVDHLGGFPNLVRPRVVWAGMSGESEQLVNIAQKLQLHLLEIGLEPDTKPFRPHLTLGRVKGNDSLTELTEQIGQLKFDPIPATFDRLELIQSTLTPRGPIYKTLGTGVLAERFE